MKEYESVQNLVYDSSIRYGRANRVPSRYWGRPDLFEKEDEKYYCTTSKCIKDGYDVITNFLSKIDPEFDRDKDPYDMGVYLIADVVQVLGYLPSKGQDGILAITEGLCKDGDGVSIIVSFSGFRKLDGIKVCRVGP